MENKTSGSGIKRKDFCIIFILVDKRWTITVKMYQQFGIYKCTG